MERGEQYWREEGSNGESREVMERGGLKRREGEGSNGERRVKRREGEDKY